MENQACKVSRWQIIKSQLNNLDPEEFYQEVKRTPDAIVIDVRTAGEFEKGHLFDAVNIDYLSCDFWDQMEALDSDQTYFVYCRSGRRSVRTCMLMKNGGFRKVYNLDGGLNLWQECFGEIENLRN
jgi:rhodanese-related sulfurtransferase